MSGASGHENDRLLSTFLELVRIDSPSGEEAEVAAYCARRLEAAGCRVRFDDSAEKTGSNTGNLIAELPGSRPEVLVLSAHMDTVEPGRGIEPVVADGIVYSAGETVLGSDDKAGLAAAIECVERLATSTDRPTLRCVFTTMEETGLVGAWALSPDEVFGDLCVVLDADGAAGGIVIAAPTHYSFKATFIGRAAHAGVAPEQGVSAIAMAAEAISRLEIGRLDSATTANVGTIHGGTAKNVIAARVEVVGECRSLDRERVEQVRQSMESRMREAAGELGGDVEIEWHLEYEGFALSDTADEVRLIAQACADVRIEARTMKTGGGSDANVISALGVPTVALSCGMQGVHSVSEQIEIADLEKLAELCVAIASRLGRDEVV